MKGRPRKKRRAPPGWEEERKERLRQQRRQKALREASKLRPYPVTITKLDSTPVKRRLTKQERYARYISSDQWAARKTEYYFLHEKVCWRCGNRSNIHLHHHTYLRLGNELNEDLVPLCQPCHQRVHALHKAWPGYDLTNATIEAIGEHPDHKNGFKVILIEPEFERRASMRRVRRR